MECPATLRQSFLLQAKEAFTIGLLTKAEGELVTSKQELHTFLKAAYSLTVTLKWLGTSQEVVEKATQACQNALANLYDYDAGTKDKDSLCAEIMHLVTRVKLLLGVEPFHNSDKGSFIPDSYRDLKVASVNFTLEGFAKLMRGFQNYHASLCETSDAKCKRSRDEMDGGRLCISALGTTIGTLNTECRTEACKASKDEYKAEELQQRGSDSSAAHAPQKAHMCTTLGNTDDLGSSWQNLSLSSSGSHIPSSSGYTGSVAAERDASSSNRFMTTETDGEESDSMQQSANNRGLQHCNSGISSHTVLRSAVAATSSSNRSSEIVQAGIETLEEDWVTDVAGMSGDEGAAQSLDHLTLGTSFSSFSSQSSWEKVSADPKAPAVHRNSQPYSQSKGSGHSSHSDSDGSFCLLETLDSQSIHSDHDPIRKHHTSQGQSRGVSLLRPQESRHVDPNMDTEANSVSLKPTSAVSSVTPRPNLSGLVPGQNASTGTSPESSFEMLDENRNGHQLSDSTSSEKANVPQRKNPLCCYCIKHGPAAAVVPERQYCLSEDDYQALLAGVCHECLLNRLHSGESQFQLKKHQTAHSK